MPVSTRVPVEVCQLVDDLAGLKGCKRAEWVRGAIEEQIKNELGQSSLENMKTSMNTTFTFEYMKVFKTFLNFFKATKKPDIAGRAFLCSQIG